MKKSLYSLVAILVTLSFVLSACGTPASTGPSDQTTEPAAESATSLAPVETQAPSASDDKVIEIRWYIGLGTGQDPQQQPIQEEVVAAFNAAHPGIKLVMEVVQYEAAFDTLATEIASGNPPDIVGPVGLSGAHSFHDQWLDLNSLVEKYNFDLSAYDEASINFYKEDSGELTGLPFAVYPSVLYYQSEMFDEIGLNYPPHKYGEKYKWPDGTEEEWNFATLRKVAMQLTVDKNGKDASQAGFDPESIEQYGFVAQYQEDARHIGNYWGADSFVESDGKTVRIPEQWVAAWQYYYDSIWVDHFHPTEAVIRSEPFGNTNPFDSGKFAMALTHFWYTCCVENAGDTWDLAVVPSYNGKVTSNINADTFRILKSTKHPDEAFQVLDYFLGEAALQLLKNYSGMPARKDIQDDFFVFMDESFVQKPDWQIATDSIPYQDIPNYEAFMPNYQEAFQRSNEFVLLMRSTPGLDLQAEIAKLKNDLQAIFDKKD